MKSKKSKQNTHAICVGIDCHKEILVCCVRSEKDGQIEYSEINTTTSRADVEKLVLRLKKMHCTHACMEETGPYTEPILSILQQNDINAQATNPRYFNHPRGNKSDSHDAKRIADVFAAGNAPASHKIIGPLYNVKILNREKNQIIDDITTEKNRLNRLLVSMNIRTDKKGRMVRTTIDFIKMLLQSQREMTEDEILVEIKGIWKSTAKRLAEISKDAVYNESMVSASLRAIQSLEAKQSQLIEIEDELKPYVKMYKKEIDLICSTQLTENCALTLLGEIGNDMSHFPKGSKQLTSLMGLAPTITASAGKNKCSKISHAGSHLKPFLIQCCWGLVTKNYKTGLPQNPYFAKIFERKKESLGGRRAIVMIARKVLVSVYHMLSKNERFMPTNYNSVMKEKKDVEVIKDVMKTMFTDQNTDEKLNFENILKILEKEGIVLDIQKDYNDTANLNT